MTTTSSNDPNYSTRGSRYPTCHKGFFRYNFRVGVPESCRRINLRRRDVSLKPFSSRVTSSCRGCGRIDHGSSLLAKTSTSVCLSYGSLLLSFLSLPGRCSGVLRFLTTVCDSAFDLLRFCRGDVEVSFRPRYYGAEVLRPGV